MKRLSLATAALLLAACSGGEPSNEDIKAALEAKMGEAQEQAKNLAANLGAGEQAAALLNNMPTIKVEKVEKVGSKKDGVGFISDVSMAINMPLVGTQTQTAPLRLVKTDSGWTISGGM